MLVAYLIDADERKISLVEIDRIDAIKKLLKSYSFWAGRVGLDHSLSVDDNIFSEACSNPRTQMRLFVQGEERNPRELCIHKDWTRGRDSRRGCNSPVDGRAD